MGRGRCHGSREGVGPEDPQVVPKGPRVVLEDPERGFCAERPGGGAEDREVDSHSEEVGGRPFLEGEVRRCVR